MSLMKIFWNKKRLETALAALLVASLDHEHVDIETRKNFAQLYRELSDIVK